MDDLYLFVDWDIDLWDDWIWRLLVAMFVAWVIWLGVGWHKSQDEIDFPDSDLDDMDDK